MTRRAARPHGREAARREHLRHQAAALDHPHAPPRRHPGVRPGAHRAGRPVRSGAGRARRGPAPARRQVPPERSGAEAVWRLALCARHPRRPGPDVQVPEPHRQRDHRPQPARVDAARVLGDALRPGDGHPARHRRRHPPEHLERHGGHGGRHGRPQRAAVRARAAAHAGLLAQALLVPRGPLGDVAAHGAPGHLRRIAGGRLHRPADARRDARGDPLRLHPDRARQGALRAQGRPEARAPGRAAPGRELPRPRLQRPARRLPRRREDLQHPRHGPLLRRGGHEPRLQPRDGGHARLRLPAHALQRARRRGVRLHRPARTARRSPAAPCSSR